MSLQRLFDAESINKDVDSEEKSGKNLKQSDDKHDKEQPVKEVFCYRKHKLVCISTNCFVEGFLWYPSNQTSRKSCIRLI